MSAEPTTQPEGTSACYSAVVRRNAIPVLLPKNRLRPPLLSSLSGDRDGRPRLGLPPMRAVPYRSQTAQRLSVACAALLPRRQSMHPYRFAVVWVLLFALAACRPPATFYDTVIRHGTVYDGSGGPPIQADVAISGDSIVAIGADLRGKAGREIDARGLAVAPGFINMLSWATESLIEDGRSQSDIRQGVTLEVMGEGNSMGPVTDTLRKIMLSQQGDITYPITWTSLRGYLDTLVAKGISPNVASFIGATTVRINVLGWEDRAPNADELARMQGLVRTAMEEGALGVGSSLIYAPAFYAKTPELIALVKAAAPYGGMYISHMRSEGNQLLQAVDELLTISRESGARAEIYHLKAAGQSNWPKMDTVLARIDSARAAGMAITADIYPYPAGATGLEASMPPWVQAGGYAKWAERRWTSSSRTVRGWVRCTSSCPKTTSAS